MAKLTGTKFSLSEDFTVARSTISLAAPVNVKALGATGDGVTNDAAAIQAAIDSGSGNVYFPAGTYNIGASTLTLAGNTNYVLSGAATLKYTGSGDALKIDRKKNITIRGGAIDLSGASGSCVGLHATGVWFLTVESTRIVQGPVNSGGVWIEPYTGWGGSYIIQFNGLDLYEGAGAYGIKLSSTDASYCTHVVVRGGWIKSKTDGIIFSKASSCAIKDAVCESVTNGISLSSCDNIFLQPGEIGASSKALDIGASVTALNVVWPSLASSPEMSFAAFKPVGIYKNTLYLKGSPSVANDYYLALSANYAYAKSLSLLAKGGGNEYELMSWGDDAGLAFTTPTTIKFNRGANLRLTMSAGGDFTPGSDAAQNLGSAALRWLRVYAATIYPGGGTVQWTAGAGTPEGAVTAAIGSLYTRTDGGANTTLYVKESGAGNTGWVAK